MYFFCVCVGFLGFFRRGGGGCLVSISPSQLKICPRTPRVLPPPPPPEEGHQRQSGSTSLIIDSLLEQTKPGVDFSAEVQKVITLTRDLLQTANAGEGGRVHADSFVSWSVFSLLAVILGRVRKCVCVCVVCQRASKMSQRVFACVNAVCAFALVCVSVRGWTLLALEHQDVCACQCARTRVSGNARRMFVAKYAREKISVCWSVF